MELKIFVTLLISALFSIVISFIIIVANKLNIIDYIQLYSKHDIVVKLFSCNFCLSFWIAFISVTLTIIINPQILDKNQFILLIPILVSVLTNKLV